MDGNGRWAQRRGLPRLMGHRAGVENIRRIVKVCLQYKLPYLTLYAFSTENWYRPQEEVKGLFQLLGEVIDRETAELHRQGIRLRHLGRLNGLSDELRGKVRKAIELTKDNTQLTLSVAFDYGGRAEILQAVRSIVENRVAVEELTEKLFSEYLYTAGLPEVDLIIRTGGEQRLSNFLLWQAAYSELYFTPIYWPDFDEKEMEKALLDYSRRRRCFGGL